MTPTRGDDGFTLVEVLIVTVLLGIVGSVVTMSLVQSMQFSRATSERAIALHDIERSLQVVGRELRIAEQVILDADGAFDERLAAQITRDGAFQIHTFTIESEDPDDPDSIQLLFQSIVEYDREDVLTNGFSGATAVTQPRRRLITDIDNGIEAVFTYHRSDGQEIVCAPDVAGDCRDAYGNANQIGIRLVRNLHDQEPIRAETRITVRNLRYQRLG